MEEEEDGQCRRGVAAQSLILKKTTETDAKRHRACGTVLSIQYYSTALYRAKKYRSGQCETGQDRERARLKKGTKCRVRVECGIRSSGSVARAQSLMITIQQQKCQELVDGMRMSVHMKSRCSPSQILAAIKSTLRVAVGCTQPIK